jgi:hypothetical protein
MSSPDPNQTIARINAQFATENQKAGERLDFIAKRTASALTRPVERDRIEDVRRQLFTEHGYVGTSDKTGVKADPWTISKFSTMMGSFEIAIKKRGVETATAAEADLYDQLCQHRLKLECVPGTNEYSRKEKLLQNGKNPFNGREDTLFSEVMRRNIDKRKKPSSRVTVTVSHHGL